MRKDIIRSLGLAAVLFFAVAGAQAAVWTNIFTAPVGGTDTNWSSTAIWAGGIVPGSSAGDTIVFASAANNATITNNYGQVTLGALNVAGKVGKEAKHYTFRPDANNYGFTFNNNGNGAWLANGVQNSGNVTIYNPITLADKLSITNRATSTGNIRLYGNIGESGGSRSLSVCNTVATNGGVTLSGANSYSGATIISAGTLTLNGGSINNSTPVSIAAGGTFDVSSASFTFHGSGPQQTLACSSASGTAAITAGTGAKAVTLASGALLSFQASNSLAGKISVAGDLNLSSNTITVNVTGSALAAGNYRLLDCTGILAGSANATPTITGTPLISGYTATISTATGSGGHVDLVVRSDSSTIPTTTTVSSSSNPSTYGQTVIFTASVQTNGVTATAATGNMIFKVNGATAATKGVSSGTAAYTNTTPMAGPYTIVAEYNGDVSYSPSSNNLTQTVNKATPVLTAPSASVITYGQTLANSTLGGGAAKNPFNSAQVTGSFAFPTPSIAPDAGITNVSVTFTPADAANYNSAATTVTVMVLESGMTADIAAVINDYAPVTLGGMTFLAQPGESCTIIPDADNYGFTFNNGGNGAWLVNGDSEAGGVAIYNPITLADNLFITNNASASGGIILGGNISESGGSRSISIYNTTATNGGVTLAASNSYSGATTIGAGTLALGSSGSVGSTRQISIAAGATFNVTNRASGFTFTGSPQQTLACSSASGTAAITAGTGAKAVTLASGALLSFQAANSLAGKISVAGDLNLSSNSITVNVMGSALTAGSYQLLDCTGTLTGSANSAPTFTGIPLNSGYTAAISTATGAGGHVDLVVTASEQTPPEVTSIKTGVGGSIMLGGIGSPGQAYVLQATTNLMATPVVWLPILTTNANSSGEFSFTDLQATNFAARYYRITTP